MREYLTVLSTFVAINIIGLNPGLFFGVCMSVVDFVFTYALISSHKSSNTVTRIERQSLALRHPSQIKCLQAHAGAIVTFELRGSAFFGSSVDTLQAICSQINLPETAPVVSGGKQTVSSTASDHCDAAAAAVSEQSRLLAAENGMSSNCYGTVEDNVI